MPAPHCNDEDGWHESSPVHLHGWIHNSCFYDQRYKPDIQVSQSLGGIREPLPTPTPTPEVHEASEPLWDIRLVPTTRPAGHVLGSPCVGRRLLPHVER